MLMTAILCAESKSRRELSTMRSNLETLAAAARRWAARNRATRWSGVSTKGGGVPPPEGSPEEGGFGEDDDGAGGASRLEVLELACGVAAVNRVASETLRGAGGAGIGGDVVWLLKRGWLWSLRGGGGAGFPLELKLCVRSLLVGGVDLGGAQIIRYPHAQVFLPRASEMPLATLWRFCSLVVSVVNAGRATGGGSDGPPKFWSRAQARQRDCRPLQTSTTNTPRAPSTTSKCAVCRGYEARPLACQHARPRPPERLPSSAS